MGQFSDERWSVTYSTGDSDVGAIMIRVIPDVGIIVRGPMEKITYIGFLPPKISDLDIT